MLSHLKRIFSSSRAEAPGKQTDILINAYCTVRDLPAINFSHVLNNQRGINDVEMQGHLQGFIGYVSQLGDGQMTRNRYHVIRHIQRVQQQVSLTIDESQFQAFAAWAQAANALVFLPDGHVRDPQGHILLSAADGSSESEATIPYPAAAWQRKERTEKILEGRGINIPRHLPPLISEPELNLRAARKVTGRALALFLVAVRAESLASKEAIPVAELHERFPLTQAFMTPNELDFLSQEDPAENDLAQFCWRYESLSALQWALGLIDELPFPEHICDVPLTASTMIQAGDAALLGKASLRPAIEILDALDLHYRLHWLSRQAQRDGRELPVALEHGVIFERHHAFNWLVQFENNDWDDVDTPT